MASESELLEKIGRAFVNFVGTKDPKTSDIRRQDLIDCFGEWQKLRGLESDGLPIELLNNGEKYPPGQPIPFKDFKPVYLIPIKSGYFKIYDGEVDTLQRTYKFVNVREELEKLCLWNEHNPKRRKTERGIMRHINTWLFRANDEAREKQGGIDKSAPTLPEIR